MSLWREEMMMQDLERDSAAGKRNAGYPGLRGEPVAPAVPSIPRVATFEIVPDGAIEGRTDEPHPEMPTPQHQPAQQQQQQQQQWQPENAKVGLWIVDTRKWYPSVTTSKQLETHAARALKLIPPSTKPKILRYYHPRDAKMALASALLKQYAVARLHGIPWSRTRGNIRSDGLHKPTYVDPETGEQPVEFNVSHQAGVVVMVAVAGYRAPPEADLGLGGGRTGGGLPDVEVGVDVVCTSESRERDRAALRKVEGWAKHVDTFADVMAPGEVEFLKRRLPEELEQRKGMSVTAKDDLKLRYFYAFWALREAYVKMTGEALGAPWLAELEFRGVRPSQPMEVWEVKPGEDDDEAEGEEGIAPYEVVHDMEIWFKGERLRDVNMSLRSVGQDYMIATAVRTPSNREAAMRWRLGPYVELTLENILDFAEASG
ncbi:hypothetical protein VTJ49DRAFT_4265 [Mycothermus thermophilus]|uniref:holo-[acyl-carrier-protein] synthase n=1 Tax=Humicola insolens TaxID=85995 RepID=A0ABR3VLW9_HUMIN